MIEKDTLIKVKNRDNGTVGYTIPELGNLHRSFSKGETKEITMDELRKLSYISGGKLLLQDYLIVQNQDALRELLSDDVEPEYYYGEEEIKKLLLTGSNDQLLDCLEFAPEGVIGLVKDLAVSLKINDISKRNIILEKTGFNVTNAITINEETIEGEGEEAKSSRRSAPVTVEKSDEAPKRRVAAPQQYNVVSNK